VSPRQAVPSGEESLAVDAGESLDALTGVLLGAPPRQGAGPGDDQATRLRSLMNAEPVGVIEAPAPAPRPQWRDDRTAALAAARTAAVVAIASGKGGVGKTNISVNLAIALAAKGLRVTLLDADLGTANADVLCGVHPAARLDHVLAPGRLDYQDAGRRTIRDIAIDAPGGFRLVPGSAGIARMADLDAFERRWLVAALIELAADADVLLIDAAAGVGAGVTTLLEAADLGVVVATPEPTAVADAYALIKCLSLGARAGQAPLDERLALVVNQAASPLEAFATHARLAGVCRRFLALDLPMLGFVAHDVRVGEAVRAQRPLLLRSPAAAAARGVVELAGAVTNILGLQLPTGPSGALSVGAARPDRGGRRGVAGLVRRLLGR
jgi:flagellar biosynthesis protein FlhG